MNVKKIILCGIITGALFLVLDVLIAITTSPILSPYANLPIWKNSPDIAAGTLFDLINGFILAGVYSEIYNGIPGSSWKKGLNYGIIIGLFRVLMGAFSTFVMYEVPQTVVITTFVASYIEIIILCVVLALIYEKL